jgi:hypothetical protein
MKKVLFILTVLSSSFVFSSENKQSKRNDNLKKIENIDELDAVKCCTRRGSSGTYGQAGYNAVTVTTCATSPISHQDAQQRACTEADAKVKLSLEIANNSSETTTIR